MTNNTLAARQYLDWYAAEYSNGADAAARLQSYFLKLLSDENFSLHQVSARVKTVESVRAKLLQKPYRRPRAQLTDRLGVRVIVYHAADVDAVASFLRSKLEVHERDSGDKRSALGLREFGYRSYHLIAHLPDRVCSTPDLRGLRREVFEVQVRSLLEHAWAEIEHGVVYKSGANLPPDLNRRFASLAGVLEILEHEFRAVRRETDELVDKAVEELQARPLTRGRLDVPRMMALLELLYPDGVSFRQAREQQRPFPPGMEQRLLLAFERSGLQTTIGLARALRRPMVRNRLRRYAEAEGIPPSELSHLAILAVLLATRSAMIFRVFFPEFAADESMRAAVA